MTTIAAQIPDNLKEKVKACIEEPGGEEPSESNLSKKKAVLKELEIAFSEAKAMRVGKLQGLTLDEILLGK